MEYMGCDQMKGKRDGETIKHWIGWFCSRFYKMNELKGRGEGQAEIE